MAVDIASVTSGGDITFTGASGALYSWSANPGNSEVSPTPNAFHVWSRTRDIWIRLAPGQSLADDAGENSVVQLIAQLSVQGGQPSTGPVMTPPDFDETGTFPGAPPSDLLLRPADDDLDDEDDLQVIAGSVGLGALIAIVVRVAGPALAGAIRFAITRIGAVGGVIGWTRLPRWVRASLIAVGVTEGTSIIIEEVTDIDIPTISDILPTFGGHDPHQDPVRHMVEALTVSTWKANGVQFHRLSDGRLAVRNKMGVWKVWRPKKPIVLFATGATDLPTLLRADRAIQKQANKIAKMLRARGFNVNRKGSQHN